MSMYNLIFGQNPASGVLLAMLDKSPSDFGRIRDVFVTEHDGRPVIAVYTRNGGGNREHYNDEAAEGQDCGCTGCTITYTIPAMDGYISDSDDDFDCTYATVLMEPPEEWHDLLTGLVREGTPDTDWRDFLAALENPPTEPESRPQQLAVRMIEQLQARSPGGSP